MVSIRVLQYRSTLFHGRFRTAYLYRYVWSGIAGRQLHGFTQAWPNEHSVGHTTDRPRPWNKCVKPLSGVGYVSVKRTYPTPDSGLTYTYRSYKATDMPDYELILKS